MQRLHLLIGLFATILFGQGCASSTPAAPPLRPPQADTTPTKPASTAPANTSTAPINAPTALPPKKPSAATYEEYTPEAYQAARDAGQPIFLNFYANWCPFCREQEPRTVALYTQGKWPAGIKGFLVHYNDSETDDADRAIADAYAVGYQHTYIFIRADGTEATRTTGTTTDAALLENLGLIAP